MHSDVLTDLITLPERLFAIVYRYSEILDSRMYIILTRTGVGIRLLGIFPESLAVPFSSTLPPCAFKVHYPVVLAPMQALVNVGPSVLAQVYFSETDRFKLLF